MRVSREFQPITIRIDREDEARVIEDALLLLIKDCMKRGGSTWFGMKDVQLSDKEKEYRFMTRRILEAINPEYKERKLFELPWN